MKKIIVIFLVIFGLSGCASLGSLFSDITNPRSGTERSEEPVQEQPVDSRTDDKTVAEKGTDSDSGKSSGMDYSAFLTPDLQFSMFYGSYFFLGGYGFGDDNFRDGEGIKWSISTNTDDSEIIVTRARLKTLGNGNAWWYFSTEIDGQEYFYELLLENDSDLVKVRYLNGNSGAFEEFIPEGAGDSDSEAVETLDSDVYNQYKVGNESVKTRAGSFKADHIIIDIKEFQFKYEYWLADRVPGHIVKYRYENTGDNQVMTGEVIDVRGGYRTRLASY